MTLCDSYPRSSVEVVFVKHVAAAIADLQEQSTNSEGPLS